MTAPMRPATYNPYPYPSRKRHDFNGASVNSTAKVPPDTDRETQLKRDLRALEAVQAGRPRKPPGKGRP